MDDQDASVRKVDEDRWLASRFAPEKARRALVAFYALNHEIARTSELVREPALGAIRLQWWRDGFEDLYAGRPARRHPAFEALAAAAPPLPPGGAIDDLIRARALDFEPAPFADFAALDSYVEGTAGAVIRTAMNICGAVDLTLARVAGRAWGLTGLLRAEPFWRGRGRSFLPPGATLDDVRQRARAAYDEARARKTFAALFPAYGYIALAPLYLKAPEKPAALMARQFKLLAAAATGKV